MHSKTPEGRREYWQKYRAEKLPYATKTCAECGAEFKPDNGPQKRCNTCRTKTCPQCGVAFIPKDGKRGQVCCSRPCAALRDTDRTERIKANRGTKPRTYAQRHRDKHGSAEDREWRTAVFERDNYTCQMCGKRGKRLQAHHIKAYKDHPELRHDLDNGQTLCVDCHKTTDTYGWSKHWHGRKEIAAKRLAQDVLPFTEAIR